MGRLCNFFQKKMHHKVLLDAKRKVMWYQVSTTTHTAAGRDQRRSGLIQPPPRSDRVKNNYGETAYDLAKTDAVAEYLKQFN